MNRLFRAKIHKGSYVMLLALLVLTVFCMWNKAAVIMGVAMVLMVVVIERMINTTYTVTSDGRLVIHKGRLSKDVTLDVRGIQRIDRAQGYRLFGASLQSSLIIVMDDGRQVCVTPALEDEFVDCIRRKRLKLDQEETEE